MRSVVHALVWDSFRFSGWAQIVLLASCMLPMAIYAMIAPAGPPSGFTAGDPVMFLLEVSLLPFVMFILIMGAGVSFANMAQLYSKPLSNLSITAWRTIGGSTLLAIQTGLIVGFYNGMFHVGWPLVGSVLFTVAMWFVMQPFFCLGGKSFLCFMVTMLPIAFMLGWLMTRYKPIGGAQRDWNEITLSETVQLLFVIGVFAWCSLYCVAIARRSDGLPVPNWLGSLWQSFFSWPVYRNRNLKPFRSVSRAMFWYEWRLKGWGLAVAYALLLGLIVPGELARSATLESYISAISAAYVAIIVPAMVLGTLHGFQLESMQISLTRGMHTSFRSSDFDQLGSFQATRPVSNARLARSKLLVCLAGIILTVALWLLLAAPAFIVAVGRGNLESVFTQHKLFVVPLTGIFMWIMMSNTIALISTGRTKLLGSAIVALLVAFVGLLSLLEWINNFQVKQLVLQSLLIALAVALCGWAIWAFARSLRSGYVTKLDLVIAGIVVSSIAIVGCRFSSLNISNSVAWTSVGVLSVMPWAATPLAIGWNRHR